MLPPGFPSSPALCGSAPLYIFCSLLQPTSSPTFSPTLPLSPPGTDLVVLLVAPKGCMEGLTGEQRIAFQEAFSLFDKNGDGLLPLTL